MSPDLSVIIVTYNGKARALATLRTALAAAGPLQVEWIVVDNGSSDGTPDTIERSFPKVRLIRGENRGFAAGNNLGLEIARGRYVLLMNPDVEVVSGTLSELVHEMDARPQVGIASVIQRAVDGGLQPSIRRFPSLARDLGEALFAARWPVLRTFQELETRAPAYAQEHSVDWLVGAFLIVRREAVAAVGPMDDGFFLYSEEVDWCYRFHQAGWDVRHLPLMTIIHHCGRHDRGRLMAELAYSRKRFARKHFGLVKSRLIQAALVFGHLVRLSVLAPRTVRRTDDRRRLGAELEALWVQIGLAPPPSAEHLARLAAPLRTMQPVAVERPGAPI